MIFGLQYALVVAGYAATAFLLGNYMILYTGASQLELGIIFTIQPAVIFVRPIVCSLADRFQLHRAIYLYCSLLSFLCHLPFIALPFVVEANRGASPGPMMSALGAVFTERVRFWVLVGSHFVGCVFFCCMRTLGDVLTVNYCRRIRTNYTKYRKLGPISFGMCSLVLGYINCNEQLLGLPDYVPGFILYSTCHMSLFVLFYLWPEECFVIVSEAQVSSGQLRPLPSSAEIRQHVKRKIGRLFFFGCFSGKRSSERQQQQQMAISVTVKAVSGGTTNNNNNNKPVCNNCNIARADTNDRDRDELHTPPPQQHTTVASKPNFISTMQQVRIIAFLVRQDLRILLYMLVLVGCGVMGHSVQNFVYVYLAVVCRGDSGAQQCSSSAISGYIMLGICVTETISYSLSSRYFTLHATRKHKLIKVEIALASLAAHYLVLALFTHHSAYYFLAEAFHGFEFGLMIATGIELGDYFANEVSLIIPQLLQRNIISESDDLAMVRVSLIATMLACFMLVYDGLGGIIGGLLFGFVVDRFGFLFAFKLNACLSSVFLATLLLISLSTRYFGPLIRPKFSKSCIVVGSCSCEDDHHFDRQKSTRVVVVVEKGCLGEEKPPNSILKQSSDSSRFICK